MATGLNEQFAPQNALAISTLELASKLCPDAPAPDGIADHSSLVSNQKAQRMLGFAYRHRWAEQPQG